MASKKRKVGDEGSVFKEGWTSEYFFTESDGKPVCLICQRTVPVMKEYSIKRDVYYSAVRWLSRGAIPKRFFYLRSEIDIFVTEKGTTVPQLSDDKRIL
jgi:hypothetical protein